MSNPIIFKNTVVDLLRLARFGATIADAYTCAIFVPKLNLKEVLAPEKALERHTPLTLAAYYSNSDSIYDDCIIDSGKGLIPWVSQNKESIHISPYKQDSRMLGFYKSNNFIRSFIGIPIALNAKSYGAVLTCDSKHQDAFNKKQGRLLSELALEIGKIIKLHAEQKAKSSKKIRANNVDAFVKNAAELISKKGIRNTKLLRLDFQNCLEMEHALGIATFEQFIAHLKDSCKKALPPESTFAELNNGSLLVALDSMLVEFYHNKVKGLIKHLTEKYRRQNCLPKLELKLATNLSPFFRPSEQANALECTLFSLDMQVQKLMEDYLDEDEESVDKIRVGLR